MAANRQERELMRQRGAGTRQIKDLEFQLVLPGQPIVAKEPESPQKSARSRRTPQKRKILGPRSSTRKPATARKKGVGKPSSSGVPISEDQEGVQGTLPTQSHPEGKATKKRRIGVKRNDEGIDSNGLAIVMDERPLKSHEEQGDLPQLNETTSQPAILQAQGKKRKKRKSIGQISRKKPRLQNVDKDPSRKKPRLQNVDKDPQGSIQPPEIPTANETISRSASLQAQGKKRKKRKSIGQNPRKKPALQNVDKDPEASIQPPDEAPRPVNHQQQAVVDSQAEETKAQSPSAAAILAIEPASVPRDSAHDLDAEEVQNSGVTSSKSPAERRPRRKKRKCIGQQKPRRKVTGVATARDSAPSARSDAPKAAPEDRDETSTVKKSRGRGRPKKISSTLDLDVRNEVLTDMKHSNVTPNPRPARGRGRPRKVMPVDAVIQGGNDEDNENEGPRPVEKAPTRKRGRAKLNVPSEESEGSTTVKKQRISKKDAKDPGGVDGKIPRASRKPPKNSMPITVNRISTNDALDSENDHPNSLKDPSAFPKDNSVNAVDALAQICREMVSKSNDSLGEAVRNERNKSKKATLERKRKNIETYGEEFENRLFQLTETPDINLALSARVRRADQEEKAFGADLKSLQEEGESIAPQTTQIEEANAKSHARATLAALLRDIEAAVRHGKETDLLQHAQGAGEESGKEAVQTAGIENPDSSLKRVGEDVKPISEAEAGGAEGK